MVYATFGCDGLVKISNALNWILIKTQVEIPPLLVKRFPTGRYLLRSHNSNGVGAQLPERVVSSEQNWKLPTLTQSYPGFSLMDCIFVMCGVMCGGVGGWQRIPRLPGATEGKLLGAGGTGCPGAWLLPWPCLPYYHWSPDTWMPSATKVGRPYHFVMDTVGVAQIRLKKNWHWLIFIDYPFMYIIPCLKSQTVWKRCNYNRAECTSTLIRFIRFLYILVSFLVIVSLSFQLYFIYHHLSSIQCGPVITRFPKILFCRRHE